MCTEPSPPAYACRTEFEQASVSASLRSASVSSPNGLSREIPVSASLQRAMYSALAGILSRISRVTAESLISEGFLKEYTFETAGSCVFRRNASVCGLSTQIPVALTLAESNRHPGPLAVAQDAEDGDLAGRQPRHEPDHVVGAPNH